MSLLYQVNFISLVFSVFCKIDVNKDGQVDCIAAGRGGLLIAINGKTGLFLWEIQEVIF
jgi:hypothetical protein